MDYYSIDDILSENEKISVQFQTDGYKLGFLDPSSNHISQAEDEDDVSNRDDDVVDDDDENETRNQDIKKGAKIELPLWLVELLADRNYVIIDLPKVFSINFRKELKAGPETMNLFDRCGPYFYEVGTKLAKITDDEALTESLMRTFAARFKQIFLSCQNSRNDDYSQFVRRLTLLEREIFDAGRLGSEEYLQWKNHFVGRTQLKTSVAMTPTKNKKRTKDAASSSLGVAQESGGGDANSRAQKRYRH
eukprot:GEZU01027440.1.p1 GENE.GEZU01027440.1~~GEZU01027440.1.p1  ORF type:complete len:248 (-),score=42.80 GEZU01027440.1:181-924(-)